MDTITLRGATYVAKKADGTCKGCVADNDEDLCMDGILEVNKNSCCRGNGEYVIWIRKDQAELNTFFGRPITEQIDMFPETLAVTQEEEEDWQTMQKKVATGVTDGTQYHRQVGGDHYFNPIQPWDIIRAWELNYWEGNIVKYVLRHKGKNKVEDLEKARHYLDYLIDNYDELYPVSN